MFLVGVARPIRMARRNRTRARVTLTATATRRTVQAATSRRRVRRSASETLSSTPSRRAEEPQAIRSPSANELPVAIGVGTQVLGGWCAFSLSYAALHATVAPADWLGFAVSATLGLVSSFRIRTIVKHSTPRMQLILFALLSGIAFVTLVTPMPLPFTNGANSVQPPTGHGAA